MLKVFKCLRGKHRHTRSRESSSRELNKFCDCCWTCTNRTSSPLISFLQNRWTWREWDLNDWQPSQAACSAQLSWSMASLNRFLTALWSYRLAHWFKGRHWLSRRKRYVFMRGVVQQTVHEFEHLMRADEFTMNPEEGWPKGLELTGFKTVISVTESLQGRILDWIIEDVLRGNERISLEGLGYLSRKLQYWFSLKCRACESEFIKRKSSVCLSALCFTFILSYSLYFWCPVLF